MSVSPAGNAQEKRLGLFGRLRLLFSDADAELVSHQLEETRTTLPVLAGFHFFATLSVYRLAFDFVATRHLLVWTIASFVAEAVLIIGYFALDHIGSSTARGQQVLRYGPFAALALCLVWGWAALVFSPVSDAPVAAYIDLLALLSMSVGLLCTLRLPATALQFVLTPVAILVTRATLTETSVNLYGLLVAAMAVLAGLSVMLALSYSFKRRVMSEKTLRHDMQVLNMLLADAGAELRDFMWETDATGRLVFHAPKFAEMLGRKGDDLEGVDFLKDFISQNAPLMTSKFLVHEDLREEPLTTRDASGLKHWRISAKPRFDGAGIFTGYRGFVQDVTTEQQHLQANARAEDDARKSSAAKAQFLSLMVRELRMPVNAIVGFSEMLNSARSESLPVVVRRDYMATIQNSGRQLQSFINDVLEATQLERGVKLDEQVDDLSPIINDAIKTAAPVANRNGISLVAKLFEDVEVAGDLARLKAIALSMLGHAISFAPQGTAVQVEMTRLANGDLALAVRDRGPAIAALDAARLLEPFAALEANASRRMGGLGLGLAIARRVARLHGGELTLAARKDADGKDAGTEALLVLPAARIRWHEINGQLKVMNIAA
ncbi:sensor histidine kinase [Aestuariivirga litoralis]|uniref:sensor histidine kinase n=1 Tax=Aestuariivirga litoralis TaxID=2650924 RepID=UPI0018C456C3|nr:PAS domain-containing sensor histidine kinase [Aestuariivirga litoralis]MBG1233142.1 PAS domain-containing sensor histidine kinase [Aestuariivirga litoralis]